MFIGPAQLADHLMLTNQQAFAKRAFWYLKALAVIVLSVVLSQLYPLIFPHLGGSCLVP